MKLAIISDIHLGDPNCTIIDQTLRPGTKFSNFVETVGHNDYLIILGDALDFSIAHYNKVYESAVIFFKEILKQNIATEIIYVPGNHDFEFWHILEHEVNVIKPILKGKLPREFRWSVPGVFDDRQPNDRDKFSLPDVTPNQDVNKPKYGDVFLSHLAVENGRQLNFNVAYPNIYIIGKNGDSALLTHGHYLEQYWVLVGEWAPKIFKDELRMADEKKKQLTLQEMVAFNFPLNQLACSGVGQAGALTELIRKIQRQVKDKELDDIKKYLNRFDDEILDKEIMAFKPYDPKEWASDAAINLLKAFVVGELQKYEAARYDKYFVENEKVRDRFINYYKASVLELARLRELESVFRVDIPIPRHIIFGHTHQPISWSDKRLNVNIGNRKVYLHNTGGWLTRKTESGASEFTGAEIFFYESGQGFYSVRVE